MIFAGDAPADRAPPAALWPPRRIPPGAVAPRAGSRVALWPPAPDPAWRCGPQRRTLRGAVAPRAVPFGTVGHSAGQGLAPGATALKRTAGGTARATRTYAED